MAALTATIKRFKLPLGKDWLVMLRTSSLAANQGGDYIPREAMGLSKIYGAVGTAMGPTADHPGFVLNSRGTDNAEDTSNGDLAIESIVGSIAFEVWVIGRGKRGTK